MSFLIGTSIFLPQSHFLPVFPWSFLLLGVLFLANCIIQKVPIKFRLNVKASALPIIITAVYICFILITSQRLTSSIYLASSILCLPLMIFLAKRKMASIYRYSVFFLYLNLCAALFELPFVLSDSSFDVFFIKPADAVISGQDYYRFRGFSLEPNHLGISLCVIYLVIIDKLFDLRATAKKQKIISLLIIWFLAYLTVSMYTLFMLGLISLIFTWNKIRIVGPVLLLICTSFLATDLGRIDDITSGQDNSANLRTWGALYLGYKQIERCGLTGCGLGSARVILEDEPEMDLFAAKELNGLPNLMANAMVEGGVILPIIYLFLIYQVSFCRVNQFRVGKRNVNLACFIILLSMVFSGSHLYDPTIWIVSGYLFLYRKMGSNNTSAIVNGRVMQW